MSKKQWYEIQVECIKFNPTCTLLVGEKNTVAKVKSYGLAFQVANFLQSIYSKEYFDISIK